MSVELSPPPIVYPESDGKPMAENTLQYRWITTLVTGLELLFRDDPDVFVAGDLLWYPFERDNKTSIAPDALVVFGRPKGERGCYVQSREDGLAPQVVFEVLSPSNGPAEMRQKLANYDRYGVEEYYVIDPEPTEELEGWRRRSPGEGLVPIAPIHGWTSPRLGVRFESSGGVVRVLAPNGAPFLKPSERIHQECERAEAERARGDIERERGDIERERANIERQRADESDDRAARLAAKLRALGLDPDA